MPTYVHAYGLGKFPRHEPQTVNEFRALVKKFDDNIVRRDEDNQDCSNCRSTRVQKTYERNDYGVMACVRGLTPGRHEALDLSEEVIEALSLRLHQATHAEIRATGVLNAYLHGNSRPGDLVQRLGQQDTTDIPECEMDDLLRLLCEAFFPSPDQLVFDFRWVQEREGLYGSCETVDGVARIHTNPRECRQSPACGGVSSRAMGRLGTLLHELVHAFIQKFACSKCSAYYSNVRIAAGHGHVWQRIPNWVEHAAKEALGVPVSLGRFTTIQVHWDDMQAFPNPAEARSWELRDE